MTTILDLIEQLDRAVPGTRYTPSNIYHATTVYRLAREWADAEQWHTFHHLGVHLPHLHPIDRGTLQSIINRAQVITDTLTACE